MALFLSRFEGYVKNFSEDLLMSGGLVEFPHLTLLITQTGRLLDKFCLDDRKVTTKGCEPRKKNRGQNGIGACFNPPFAELKCEMGSNLYS